MTMLIHIPPLKQNGTISSAVAMGGRSAVLEVQKRLRYTKKVVHKEAFEQS